MNQLGGTPFNCPECGRPTSHDEPCHKCRTSASPSPVSQTDEEIAKSAAEACLSLDEPDDQWLITAAKVVILTALRRVKAGQEEEERKAGALITHEYVGAGGQWRPCEILPWERDGYITIKANGVKSLVPQRMVRAVPLEEKEAVADHVSTVLQKTLNLLLRYCGWEHNYRPDGVELSMSRPRDVQEVEKLCAALLSTQGVSSTAAGVSSEKWEEIASSAARQYQFYHPGTVDVDLLTPFITTAIVDSHSTPSSPQVVVEEKQ